MSRIKNFEEQNKINIIKMFKDIFELDNKSVETLFRIFKNFLNKNDNIKNRCDFINENLKSWGIEYNTSKLNPIEIMMISTIVENVLWSDIDIKGFKEFISYFEKNKTKEKDLTKINDMYQINKELTRIKLNEDDEKLSKEIYKIHNCDKFLILRPFTFESSLKYGSNTKWCTAMKTEPSYFRNYSNDGILIYIINKDNGEKFAGYKNKNELSFWDAIDNRIDSFNVNIPNNLKERIFDEFKMNKTNRELYNEMFGKNDKLELVDNSTYTMPRWPIPTEVGERIYNIIDNRNVTNFDVTFDENGRTQVDLTLTNIDEYVLEQIRAMTNN